VALNFSKHNQVSLSCYSKNFFSFLRVIMALDGQQGVAPEVKAALANLVSDNSNDGDMYGQSIGSVDTPVPGDLRGRIMDLYNKVFDNEEQQYIKALVGGQQLDFSPQQEKMFHQNLPHLVSKKAVYFFKFIQSVYYVWYRIQGLRAELSQANSIEDNQQRLDAQILSPDNRPWELVDQYPTNQYYGKDLGDAGQLLGKTKLEINPDGKGKLTAKLPKEKEKEEALLLAYPMINYMVALQQGRYRDGKNWVPSGDNVKDFGSLDHLYTLSSSFPSLVKIKSLWRDGYEKPAASFSGDKADVPGVGSDMVAKIVRNFSAKGGIYKYLRSAYYQLQKEYTAVRADLVSMSGPGTVDAFARAPLRSDFVKERFNCPSGSFPLYDPSSIRSFRGKRYLIPNANYTCSSGTPMSSRRRKRRSSSKGRKGFGSTIVSSTGMVEKAPIGGNPFRKGNAYPFTDLSARKRKRSRSRSKSRNRSRSTSRARSVSKARKSKKSKSKMGCGVKSPLEMEARRKRKGRKGRSRSRSRSVSKSRKSKSRSRSRSSSRSRKTKSKASTLPIAPSILEARKRRKSKSKKSKGMKAKKRRSSSRSRSKSRGRK
jgi:hypothetical protein